MLKVHAVGLRCTSTSPIRRAIRSQYTAAAERRYDDLLCATDGKISIHRGTSRSTLCKGDAGERPVELKIRGFLVCRKREVLLPLALLCLALADYPSISTSSVDFVEQALEAFAASIKAGQREEAMRAAKRSKGLVDGHTDELADTLAKIGVDDEEEDKKIGQSPIERHKLLAWRPPTNGKINIDVFKSKDGTSHSVNVKGAKSWSEFQEAVTQLVQAVRELVPDVDIKQNQARVALTKSSFHIGHCIDIGNLNIADNFAEVCTRKKKGGEAALGKTAKTNGGLVLKLHKYEANGMPRLCFMATVVAICGGPLQVRRGFV
eukprot:753067-Hanusia_phi.AAC.11